MVLNRRMLSLARRFMRDRRQGFAGDLLNRWRRIERILIDRRIDAESGPSLDTGTVQAAVVLDEIADLRARLRRIETMLAKAASEGDDKPGTHDGRTPVLPLRLADGGIGADQYMPPDNGFYALECDASGRLYRWTGPTHEFRFDLDHERATPTTLQLVLLGSVRADQCENLGLLVDDQPVALTIRREGDRWLATFVLPACDRSGLTSLQFVVPRLYRPVDLGQGDDRRPLGVQFAYLQKIS
jgi:hypothetical protein